MRLVKNEMYIDKGVMSQKLTGHIVAWKPIVKSFMNKFNLKMK